MVSASSPSSRSELLRYLLGNTELTFMLVLGFVPAGEVPRWEMFGCAVIPLRLPPCAPRPRLHGSAESESTAQMFMHTSQSQYPPRPLRYLIVPSTSAPIRFSISMQCAWSCVHRFRLDVSESQN